jgi:hypothetical protein
MIRTAPRLCSIPSIFTAIFAITAFVPASTWAVGQSAAHAAAVESASSDESSDALDLIVMGDFNRDGIADKAEITWPGKDHSGPASLIVSLGQAGGIFRQALTSSILSRAPRSIVVGDFNRDGLSDLIVGNDDGSLLLFLGDGTGRMAPAGEVAHLDSVVSIAVADFNHDGLPDLAVTDWRASSVTVLLGAGNGSFRRVWSFPLRMPGTTPHVAVADFNGDGILDLAVVYDDEGGDMFEVMLGNGNGFFTDAPALSFVKDPNAHCAT